MGLEEAANPRVHCRILQRRAELMMADERSQLLSALLKSIFSCAGCR